MNIVVDPAIVIANNAYIRAKTVYEMKNAEEVRSLILRAIDHGFLVDLNAVRCWLNGGLPPALISVDTQQQYCSVSNLKGAKRNNEGVDLANSN